MENSNDHIRFDQAKKHMLLLQNIASRFKIEGEIFNIRPLGKGLINDNYLVETRNSDSKINRYVLQRINTNVFKDPLTLQENIKAITCHIRKILTERNEEDVERKVLTCIDATEGGTTVTHDGQVWRMTLYIADSVTIDDMTPELACTTGEAFGDFHSMLMTGDTPALAETIPDFHNVPFRIRQLKDAVQNGDKTRIEETQDLIAALLEREEEMTLAERLHSKGELPKRICHCDTKIDNILFDRDGNVLCVIDLDTTMPGFVMSDFGDFIRTAGNTGKEDEEDTTKVGLNKDVFKAFAKGYVKSASFLTDTEKETLAHGAQRLTYMQTVRFLTDYLNGDVYYKTLYPGHNLVRTKAQYALLKSIDENINFMNNFIKNL